MKKLPKLQRLQRFALDQCYFYGEYNETINYAKMNSHLEGVNACIEQLDNERKQYEQEMEKVIDSEKGNENKKYHFWETWRKIKFISLGIFIGSIVLGLLADSVVPYGVLEVLLTVFIFLLWFVMLIFCPIVAIIQLIGRLLYFRYANGLREQLYCMGRDFEHKARACYFAIDEIYLKSLDPMHREMVLMRREQNEHNRRLEGIEEERRKTERENLEENRRIRYAQEQLLDIEREREKRRWG